MLEPKVIEALQKLWINNEAQKRFIGSSHVQTIITVIIYIDKACITSL